MAAADPAKDLKEEVTCPICRELFRDPVTTECGHSFCRECITRHCQGDGDVACPLCQQKLRQGNFRPNRELRNIVELVRSQPVEEPRGGNLCETHRQPLQLYCKEDLTRICVVCDRSQAHHGHTVVPVEEAVQEHRESIRQQLEGIESSYKTLHQLVSRDWTHLPQSVREEEHQRLKRLTDDVATLFKVDTEGPRQRSEGAVSQTQPCDPRKDAGDPESQEHKGREPGSEREHGRKQASLDPTPHTISDTPEAAEFQVDARQTENRAEDGLSPTPAEGSGGSVTDATPASRKQKGAAMGGGNEAAGQGQPHPGSKAAKKKKRKNKKSR